MNLETTKTVATGLIPPERKRSMHVNTQKSRIASEDSPQVKKLRSEVEKLEIQIEELKRRLPAKDAPGQPPEGKPHA